MVGHGFDYNDHFRDMLHVCIINKHGIDKFKMKNLESKTKEKTKVAASNSKAMAAAEDDDETTSNSSGSAGD